MILSKKLTQVCMVHGCSAVAGDSKADLVLKEGPKGFSVIHPSP